MCSSVWGSDNILLKNNIDKINWANRIKVQLNIGASPSGKASGFGPDISEVRILPPQPLNSPIGEFFVV